MADCFCFLFLFLTFFSPVPKSRFAFNVRAECQYAYRLRLLACRTPTRELQHPHILIKGSTSTGLCKFLSDMSLSFPQAYSQDAYLKGHDAYSGNARHIPEPPPICYPRVDCKPLGMAEATEITTSGGLQSDLGYRMAIPVPPSPPSPPLRIPKTQTAVCVCNESVRTVVVPADVHVGHLVPGEYSHAGPDPMLMRTRSYLHPRKPDLYSPGYHGDSYAVPPPRYHPSSSSVSPASRQNIDWRTYQTYREYIDHKGLHTYSRTIQERLDSLRAAAAASQTSSNFAQKATWGSKIRRRSTSHDRSYQGPPMLPARSASQDRMIGAERASRAEDWPPRSISSDGIIRNARFHSMDYVEHSEMAPWPVDRRGYTRTEQGPRPSRQPVPQRPVTYPHSYGNNVRGRSGPHQLSCRTDIPPPAVSSDRISRVGKNQPKEAQSSKDPRLLSHHVGVSVASQQSRTRVETMQSPDPVKEPSVGQRSTSCSLPTPQRQAQPAAPGQRIHLRDLKGLSVNGCSPGQGVVMREKPSTGKSTPLRHRSYIQAQEHQDSLFSSANLNESLDSIPFIGKCRQLSHHSNKLRKHVCEICGRIIARIESVIGKGRVGEVSHIILSHTRYQNIFKCF